MLAKLCTVAGISGVLLSAVYSEMWGQSFRLRVQGTVVDSTGFALPFVTVFTSQRDRLVTDDSGNFQFTAGAGGLVLELRRIGYLPTTTHLHLSRDTAIRITMTRVPQPVAAHQVIAQRIEGLARVGYYQRLRDRHRGLNNGYFITPEEIQMRRVQRTTQYLDGVPGVRLQYVSGAGLLPVGAGGCAMTVYLDGSRLQTAGTSMRRGSQGARLGGSEQRIERDLMLDHIVDPASIAAIEIYPRAVGAPPQFQVLNGTCGVIVIWTVTG
jgi:hypothetical protein